MCGITALLATGDESPRPEQIKRMSSAIRHRGPDGAAFARVGNGRALLGHVRLSIIDLARGAQPLFNEDGTIALVVNGEIYGYKQHRANLIRAGHSFRTESDSEVIVHLYEEHGLDFISLLNGEFAFVLFDERRQQLIAARDRIGVKPLYYAELDSLLAFSSEAKGIFALPGVQRALCPDYLVGSVLGAFTDGKSAFSGIRAVKPGHVLVATSDEPPIERAYWTPDWQQDSRLTREECCARVRELFTAAVNRRMLADVPVGAYLSGGIDSTLVCSLMAGAATGSGRALRAFNVGFSHAEYDESGAARQTAARLGAQYESVHCSEDSLADELERTLYHVELALANPSAVGKQMLSRAVAARGYKVCLTGEGADELFGGYAYFKQEALLRQLLSSTRCDRVRARILWSRFRRVEGQSEGTLWHHCPTWRRVVPWFGHPSFHQLRLMESSRLVSLLISPAVLSEASSSTPQDVFLRNFPASAMRNLHPFNVARRVALSQLSNYVIPAVGDRVEMANSVECRTPFLDSELIDFVLTVPPDFFLDLPALREKALLRDAFRTVMPDALVEQAKRPFLSGSWRQLSRTKRGHELFEELCGPRALEQAGLFVPSMIAAIRQHWESLPEIAPQDQKLDVFMGLVLGTQFLHQRFVEGRVDADANFAMDDRSQAARGSLPPLSTLERTALRS
jgi:asparagine synthase (glutamine-hydrolysing)